MRRHATIGNLVLLMLICAVGFAGLSHPSPIANELIFAASALVLASAALAAVNLPRGRREYWACFAIFGWAYLLLSLTPHGEHRLPTTRLLKASRSALVRAEPNAGTEGDVALWTTTVTTAQPSPARQNLTWLTLRNNSSNVIFAANASEPYEDYFLGIGHSFLAVLIGWLAALIHGMLAGFAARSAQRRLAAASLKPEAVAEAS